MGGWMGCGQPRWWIRQHHSLLSAAQVSSGSTAQLCPGGGGVGGGVVPGVVCGWVDGNGVGGGGGGVVLGRAVVQPFPKFWQQNSCWAGDQAIPASQSYGSEVAGSEHSHR